MKVLPRKFKFSGRISEDDAWHRVQAVSDQIIAPKYVNIPGIGNIPQYADSVVGTFVGYNPAQDCEGYFMSFKFQPNNNCYNYSCNIASNSFAQPGRCHSYQIPEPLTGPNVQKGAQEDGLLYVGTDIADLKKYPATDGHRVVLLISQADTDNGWPGDYHWVRCDDNVNFQSWSQKDGNDQVTNFDFAGNSIIDPSAANWVVNQGPISQQNADDLVVSYQFFCYMFVPWGKVDIL